MTDPQQVSGATSANGSKTPRKKRVEDSRFPYRVDFGITAEMFLAINRMMRGPFKQSQVGQLILHDYFLRNDPHYRAAIEQPLVNGKDHATT